MNELQVFNFEENEVKTFVINDTPYFAANDVARILGYKNPSKATNDHCKKATTTWGNDSLGRRQKFKVIPESDLYRLIIKSQLPDAERFENWVMEEVLPQIRKHGMYATQELLDNPDLLIQVATELKQERTQRMIAEQKVQELQPKADYYDKILQNKGLITVTSIAKNYGMSATKFNKLLNKLGVQFCQSNVWFLYRKYQDKGYTHTEPFDYIDNNGNSQVKMRTKWTQKGHLFIYNLLKQNDVLPLIERED